MAEDKGQPAFAPEIGDPAEGDTDILFRAQMGAYNFLAKNWQRLLGVLGVALLGVLAYSLYLDYDRNQQRELQARIADIDRKMPKPDPMAAMLGTPQDDPADEQLMANLKEGARRYEAVGADGNGTGAVMAWMRAADTYERAGDTEGAARALEQAHGLSASGALGWSAAAQLAALKADTGDVDGAAALYQPYAAGDGFIAEHATLELGLMYEVAGRTDEARTTLGTFGERFPESALVPLAAEALGRLGG